MASVSRPRVGAGGKIVRPRRRVGPITPYERPLLIPRSREQKPSWISRIILSPTRLIATGAGKVISSLFVSDDPSSSSSHSSDSDSGSENGSDEDNPDNDLAGPEADIMNESGRAQTFKLFQDKPHSINWNSETKRVIERLLMQETFSREECDRLTNIIRVRVVDSPSMADIHEGEQNRTVDNAITEVQKWLEEKNLTSKPELNPRSTVSKSVMLSQICDNEGGSPVDLAKSYMRSRPPWASPSSNNLKSPSLSSVQLFREETPFSVGGKSGLSSKLQRDSPATGSWNILEEIRRVRSRATEIRTPPSKINWSGRASDCKTTSSAALVDHTEGCMRNKTYDSSKLTAAMSLDTEVNARDGFIGVSSIISQNADNGLLNNALPPDPALLVEKVRDTEPACLVKGTEDSRLHEANGSLGKEVIETSSTIPSNGGQFPRQLDEEKIQTEEASVEVAAENDDDNTVVDSPNSSSINHDGPPEEDSTWQNTKLGNLASRTGGVSQRGRKVSRYNRRGSKGQGK